MRLERACSDFERLEMQAKESGVTLTQYASYAELASIRYRLEDALHGVNEIANTYGPCREYQDLWHGAVYDRAKEVLGEVHDAIYASEYISGI